MNKISVIIPVYNAEKSIEKCLDSVIKQTYKNWELIAIDDGSKDNSFEILVQYSNIDSRIFVETKPNEGPGLTRNRGLDKAIGDFIVFLDSDDYLESNYFELLNEEIIHHGTDVVFVDVIQEKPDGTLIKHEQMSKFKALSRIDLIGSQMTGYMPWGGCRKAASRLLIEKHHLRYSEDVVGEEAIFSFDLLRFATKIGFIEQSLYHYVNHENSQSKNPNGSWEITLMKMQEHLDKEKIKEDYQEALNAFAFTVLILWLLREVKLKQTKECNSEFKQKINAFEKLYGWNISANYLRKEVKLLVPIVKYRLSLPLVIAAKGMRR